MILTQLSDLKKYSEYLNIEKIDFNNLFNYLSSLPMGKTLIDEERIFINKFEIETKDEFEQTFEVHKKYIDIHIILFGNEKNFVSYTTDSIIKEYDTENDYSLIDSKTAVTEVNLTKDLCVIYFPGENHKTSVKLHTDKVLKCVIKVLD